MTKMSFAKAANGILIFIQSSKVIKFYQAVQVNNYDIVINFLHTSHNLT